MRDLDATIDQPNLRRAGCWRPWIDMSLEEAQNKLPDRTYNHFFRLWVWSVVRFSGRASHMQDNYLSKHGREALFRRINRVRRVLGLALYK